VVRQRAAGVRSSDLRSGRRSRLRRPKAGGGALRVDVAWDDASAGLAVTLACLPGVDGTVELVDPVDELGVGDEPGARLLCGFELPGPACRDCSRARWSA